MPNADLDAQNPSHCDKRPGWDVLAHAAHSALLKWTATLAVTLKVVMLHLVALNLVACEPQGDDVGDGADSESSIALVLPTDTRIDYVLQTSWEGATWEHGIPVVTDADGTSIGISSLRMSTGTLELIECPTQRHHSLESDSSAVFAILDEDLVQSEAKVVGPGYASGVSYCEVRMLSVTSEGLLDLDPAANEYASLVLEGWTRPAGSSEMTPLFATVALADGSIRPISALRAWPQVLDLPADAQVAIDITRRPALAFERLAVLELEPAELAFELIGEVLRSSSVTAARQDTEPS